MGSAYRGLLDKLAFMIFGQRAPDGSGDANNVAGNSGHGGGTKCLRTCPTTRTGMSGTVLTGVHLLTTTELRPVPGWWCHDGGDGAHGG